MAQLAVNQATLADLRTMEEGTEFGVVRAYFDDPTTAISQLGVVQEGWDLCEVGACLVNPDAVEADLIQLLEAGAMKFAVPFLKQHYDLPWRTEHCVLLADFKDDRQKFDVLYLPPIYLIKARPNKG